MQDIPSAVARLKAAALHTLEQHPRHITAAIAAVLLGGGGGAFAVASLGPDAATMPVREVLEVVEPLPLQEQSDALDVHRFNLYLSDAVRANDTVDSLLARLGVSDASAAAFMRQDANVRQQLLGLNGRQVRVETTEDHQLARLTARWAFGDNNLFKRLVVERGVGKRELKDILEKLIQKFAPAGIDVSELKSEMKKLGNGNGNQ